MWEGLRHGANRIHAQDDMFHLQAALICQLLIDEQFPLPWSARIRADTPTETLEIMKRAGCHRVHVGIEALDDKLLNWMHKGFTTATIRRFLSDCQRLGMEVMAYLIVGVPGETDSYRSALLPELKNMGVGHIYLNILYPFPHTGYYRALLASGQFNRDYWRDFAAKPTSDWELPLPRPEHEQRALEAFADREVERYA